MHKGMKENPVKSSQEGINKPWREISEETNLADTLILDFQPPELRKKLFLSFKPPSFWGFCYDSPSRLIQLLCTGFCVKTTFVSEINFQSMLSLGYMIVRCFSFKRNCQTIFLFSRVTYHFT